MKKLLVLILILALFCSSAASAESIYEWFDTAFGTEYSFAAVGDRLVIICDYDQLGAESTDLITGSAEFHHDDLIPYSSLVLLMMKDEMIYLGAELPLVDGTIVKGSGHPLMSMAFLQNNISTGN